MQTDFSLRVQTASLGKERFSESESLISDARRGIAEGCSSETPVVDMRLVEDRVSRLAVQPDVSLAGLRENAARSFGEINLSAEKVAESSVESALELEGSKKYERRLAETIKEAQKAVKEAKADFAVYAIDGIPCFIALTEKQFEKMRFTLKDHEISYIKKIDTAPMPIVTTSESLQHFERLAEELARSGHFKNVIHSFFGEPCLRIIQDSEAFREFREEFPSIRSKKGVEETLYPGVEFPKTVPVPGLVDLSDKIRPHLENLNPLEVNIFEARGKSVRYENPDPASEKNCYSKYIYAYDESIKLPKSPEGFSDPELHIRRTLNRYLIEEHSDRYEQNYDSERHEYRTPTIEVIDQKTGKARPLDSKQSSYAYLNPGDKIRINGSHEFTLPEFKHNCDPFLPGSEKTSLGNTILNSVSAVFDYINSGGKIKFFINDEGQVKQYVDRGSQLRQDITEEKNGNVSHRRDGKNNKYYGMFEELADLHHKRFKEDLTVIDFDRLNLNIDLPLVHVGGLFTNTYMLEHHRIEAAIALGLKIVIAPSSIRSLA